MIKRNSVKSAGAALVLLTGQTFCSVSAQKAEPANTLPSRPGIAVKLMPGPSAAKDVDLVIALDTLVTPNQKPRFEGVRFYTYNILIGAKPNRVGYVADASHFQSPKQAVILEGRKYEYTDGSLDRTENGSMSIERISGSDKYHVVGVYSYSGELFVVNLDLAAGDKTYLYEKPNV